MLRQLLPIFILTLLSSCGESIIPHEPAVPDDFPTWGRANMLWEVTSAKGSVGVRAIELMNGDIFVAGSKTDSLIPRVLYLARLNGSGEILWDSILPDFRSSYRACLAELSDGTVMVAAETDWGKNMGFVKVGTTGVQVYRIPYPRDQEYEPHEMIATPDGNFVVMGENIYADKRWFVSKYTPAFDRLWEYQHEAGQFEQLGAITVAADGSGDIIVTGGAMTQSFGDDALVAIRLTQTGSEVWEKIYQLDTWSPGKGITFDPKRNAYLVSAGENDWEDTLDGANFIYINDVGEQLERISNRFAHGFFPASVRPLDTAFLAHCGDEMHLVSTRSNAVTEYFLKGDWDHNYYVLYLRNGDVLSIGGTESLNVGNESEMIVRRYHLE